MEFCAWSVQNDGYPTMPGIQTFSLPQILMLMHAIFITEFLQHFYF